MNIQRYIFDTSIQTKTRKVMKTTTNKITLSNGTELNNIYTVLETLAVNGYKNARIIFKGEGVCDGKNGESLTFKYN